MVGRFAPFCKLWSIISSSLANTTNNVILILLFSKWNLGTNPSLPSAGLQLHLADSQVQTCISDFSHPLVNKVRFLLRSLAIVNKVRCWPLWCLADSLGNRQGSSDLLEGKGRLMVGCSFLRRTLFSSDENKAKSFYDDWVFLHWWQHFTLVIQGETRGTGAAFSASAEQVNYFECLSVWVFEHHFICLDCSTWCTVAAEED